MKVISTIASIGTGIVILLSIVGYGIYWNSKYNGLDRYFWGWAFSAAVCAFSLLSWYLFVVRKM